MRPIYLLHFFLIIGISPLHAQIHKKEQDFDIIYEEKAILPYDLPRLLETEEGTMVSTSEQWMNQRRPQILSLFSNLIYGRVPVPETPIKASYSFEKTESFLGGRAQKNIMKIELRNKRGVRYMRVMEIIPVGKREKIPALMQLSFDPLKSDKWKPKRNDPLVLQNNIPIGEIMKRGYAFVAVHHEDLVAHNEVEFRKGIHQLFFKTGQSFPKANEWGVLAAISWSASRALDYLETHPEIDASRIALMGHSKLGKATLWAVAQDQRFALAISAQSGCGGAALWRRKYGETLAKISIFPHWLCTNSRKFINLEHDLPIDQHMLLALIAPRPLLVSSAADDHWADPRGEYLSAYHANEVYELLGKKGLESGASPEVGVPMIDGDIGYFIRQGGHTVNTYDWAQYVEFMDQHMKP